MKHIQRADEILALATKVRKIPQDCGDIHLIHLLCKLEPSSSSLTRPT